MTRLFIFFLIILNLFSNSKTENQVIGKITDFDTFSTELSKKIDLDKYDLTVDTYHSISDSYDYTYVLKEKSYLTEDSSNYQFTIEDTKLTLLTTVGMFLEENPEWSISVIGFEEVYNPSLNQDLSGDRIIFENDYGKQFVTYAMNPNGQGKLKDAIIKQVSFEYDDGSPIGTKATNSNTANVKMFGNITNDSSLDDIITELGYPEKIYYSMSVYNGEVTISMLQLDYSFKSETKSGSVTFTVYPIKSELKTAVDYISSISYLIDEG